MTWFISKVQTNNGLRLKINQNECGLILSEQTSEDGAKKILNILSQKFAIAPFNSEEDLIVEKGIPFIGIISKDGYIEYYDELTAEMNDYHHSFCLSEKGLEYYDDDSTLRFIYYEEDKQINILGDPALDPFEKGLIQLKKMCELLKSNGVPSTTDIFVEQHHLNTKYENKVIGQLKTFI